MLKDLNEAIAALEQRGWKHIKTLTIKDFEGRIGSEFCFYFFRKGEVVLNMEEAKKTVFGVKVDSFFEGRINCFRFYAAIQNSPALYDWTVSAQLAGNAPFGSRGVFFFNMKKPHIESFDELQSILQGLEQFNPLPFDENKGQIEFWNGEHHVPLSQYL